MPLPLPVIVFLLVFLAIVSFFFSAAETSIISLSKIKVRNLLGKGKKSAQSLHRITSKLDRFIAAILIGNNFVNIAISALATSIFVYYIGYRWGVLAATVGTTIFILVFCEITPKILATKRAERLALLCAPLLEVFIGVFHPVLRVFVGISNFLLKLLGLETTRHAPLITEEEMRLMIEIGKEEGVLTDEERKMFHRIFKFGDTTVSEVMIPKDKIVAVDVTATPEQFLDILAEKGHERIPIYENTIDSVIGIIYIKDLLYILRDRNLFVLRDLLRPAHCIEPTKKINELLLDFQSCKFQIAIVVDKNKKTLGMVTLDDLTEEIVGEIDEYIKLDGRSVCNPDTLKPHKP